MDPLPIPDWIRKAPDVDQVADWHLPDHSGISGPPAGAYRVDVKAENSVRPMPMWHLLFDVTDQDLEELARSRILVLACSVVPVFQVYPFHRRIDGTPIEDLGFARIPADAPAKAEVRKALKADIEIPLSYEGDTHEIEALRTLRRLAQAYLQEDDADRS